LAEPYRLPEARTPIAEAGPTSRLLPTVLLVDDQAAHRKLVERQLKAGGYRVIAAASGRDALAILTQQATSIDLLLTDIMMPGMVGPQLVAIVQIRWPALRALHDRGSRGVGAAAAARRESPVSGEAVHRVPAA
jgi:two-component system, cell cycle sensor histidine kinase and response regulator CckA